MAIAAGTVWECNASATANNVNGGGFNPTNANMATDLTTDTNTGNTASPVVSSASYNFVAGDVGHWLFVKSGTNWTSGWYQIASVASNKATLSADIGDAIQRDSNKGFPTPYHQLNTVAGVATVGTPTGGVWSIDYSQTTAAGATATDLVLVTTTTATSATASFTAAQIGNIIHITAGSGFTAEWYEITNVSAGTATLDRAAGTASSTGGTFYVGGAMSLNSTLDSEFLIRCINSGGFLWIKSGSYTLGESINSSTSASLTSLFKIVGYTTYRGDTTNGSSRPTIAAGANSFLFSGSYLEFYNLIITTTAANGFNITGVGVKLINLKVTNTSTTASRIAIATNALYFLVHNCEAISYRGIALTIGNFTYVNGCYLHSSNVGISVTTVTGVNVTNCIIESCTTQGAVLVFSYTSLCSFINNTFYGKENVKGTAISLGGSIGSSIEFFNNIIYGWATGITCSSAQTGTFLLKNNFYNNTTDVSNVQKDTGALALAPSFTSVSQITGTGATAGASDNILTDSTKDFTASGVVAGRDYVYIVSGTNTTAGIYGITSVGTTTLTLDLDPTSSSTGSNIVYEITIGHNYAIGTNLKAMGYPDTYPASLTTSYTDVGAVQRQESTGGGGGGECSFVFAG